MSRRRTAVRFSVIIAILVLLALVPQAQPSSVFDRLSSAVPADALLFAAVRADDAIIAEVDALLAEAVRAVGIDTAVSVDQLLQNIFGRGGLDIERDVRPWLGDAVAAYGGMTTSGLVFDVRDDQLARSFIERYMGDIGGFTPVIREGVEMWVNTTLYPSQAVVFGDGAVVITTNTDSYLLQAGLVDDISLSRQSRFARAFAALPFDDYIAVAYVDVPTMLNATARFSGQMSQQVMQALARAVGPAAFGLTRAGDAIAVDAVLSRGNVRGLEALGFDFAPVVIGPDVLDLVPDDAVGVIHGTNLLGGPLQIRDFVTGRLGDTIIGDVVKEAVGESDLNAFLDLITLNTLGVSISDVSNWMAGDYAAFVRLRPSYDCLNFGPGSCVAGNMLVPDVAIAFETANPALAEQTLVDFAESLRLIMSDPYRSTTRIVEEMLPSGIVWRLQLVNFSVPGYQDLFAFGTDGAHVVFGTPDAVRDTLLGVDGATPDWLLGAASQTPADAGMAWYVNPRAAIAAGAALEAGLASQGAQAANRALQGAASLFDTASITMRVDEDGNTIFSARLNLTTDSQRPEVFAAVTATGAAVQSTRDANVATATQAASSALATRDAETMGTQVVVELTELAFEGTAFAVETAVVAQHTQFAATEAMFEVEREATRSADQERLAPRTTEQAGQILNRGEAELIQVNQVYQGQITPGTVEQVMFYAHAGATYQIEYEGRDFVRLFLETSSGLPIARDPSDDFWSSAATIERQIDTAGLYAVVIRPRNSNDNGSYTLTLTEQLPVLATWTPIPTLTPLAPVSEDLNLSRTLPFGSSDSTTFTPPSQGTFVITVTSTDFDPTLTVHHQLSGQIGFNDDGVSGTTNAQLVITLGGGESYELIVRSYSNNGGGSYTLDVERID